MIIYGPDFGTYTVGGKAAGLYRLQQKTTVSVPPFLVIPAETFDPILHTAPTNASQRGQILRNFLLTDADQTILAHILTNWQFPDKAVVVRSSVADEDGQQCAFPGLMDSFLNLTSLPDVYEAVARCAASAWSERAMTYRQQKNLTLLPRPAVIIQQQIIPVASGVLFTTFPEFPQEMAIHAAFGFGEGLVSGQLVADEFYYLKQTGQLHRQVIAEKTEQLVAQTKKGLRTVAVPTDKESLPCLTVGQMNALFEIGTELENACGQPQDVEFVLTDSQLFVVQARPITQPIPEVIVYDNSNIQESYCGVTTPLTFSFASRAYATVYRQTMQTLGLPKATIRAHERTVTNLLGLVKGRIYYNINNWYRGLQLLPSFSQNKADMERMMGLEEPVDFVTGHEKTIAQKAQMLPGLVLNLSRLLWAFNRLKSRISAFQEHFTHHYHRFYAQPLSSLSAEELLTQKQVLDTALLGNWTTPIINDFYVMMTNGNVVRKLTKAGISNPDEFLSRYLSGDKQIESTQPVRAMYHLTTLARQQPALRQLILQLPHTLHEQIQANFPTFTTSVNQFIDQFGDRTVGELKLETVTMRLDPLVFYRYLKNYLIADLPTEPLTATSELHTGATQELTTLLTKQSVLFRRSVWRQLARLQQAIRYRESLRLERTRLFGMYRALYLAIGNRFVETGLLAADRGIFYLTETEISRAITKSATPHPNPSPTGRDLPTEFFKSLPVGEGLGWGVADLAAHRQLEFAGYEKEIVPARVTVPSPPVLTETAPTEPDVLRGTGCVSGTLTGEVIVITDPRDSLDVTGKIVCALRTDPGWAVLFPTCRAVLIEKGSSLSHSVILLRELGLPTIINIPGLTQTLQTGQTVMLNGSTGIINVLPNDDH